MKDASTDLDQVKAWWRQWPDASVGLVTGVGFDVVDCDGPEGIEAFLGWCGDRSIDLDALPRVVTGRVDGGRHVLIAPTGRGNENPRLPHVDYRGDGGYVVAPPSRHISGNEYSWKVPPNGEIPALDEESVTDLFKPEPREEERRAGNWVKQTRPGSKYGDRALADELAVLAGAPNGERNATLNSTAFSLFQLVAGGVLDEGDVTNRLGAVARGLGLGDREIEATLKSARKSGFEEPRSAPTSSPVSDVVEEESGLPRMRQDLDNARRFAHEHRHEVRWSAGQWYTWDGRRWEPVEAERVRGMAQGTVDEMLRKALSGKNEAEMKWAINSRSTQRISAILREAAAVPPILTRSTALDSRLDVLNALDGTIDLRSGRLREHRQADLITKIAPVTFQGTDADEDWASYLELVLPDATVRRWLQLLVGASLLGRNSEERLPYLHGPAATGKSTTLEAIRCALGDYAGVVALSDLLERSRPGPRPEIVKLRGMRFVVASEMSEGEKWNAGLVKSLTGGEAISARGLHSNSITFLPSFTLFAMANSTPKVDSEDDGMWRRLAIVRFDQRVEKRDPKVKARLTDPDRTGGAVLRWAVEGCLEYQRAGLGDDPEAIRTATMEYRQSQDRISGFLDDELFVTRDQVDHLPAGELYSRYQQWCTDNGERFPLTQHRLGKLLRTRGCEPGFNPGKTTRWWFGIRWREPDDPNSDLSRTDRTLPDTSMYFPHSAGAEEKKQTQLSEASKASVDPPDVTQRVNLMEGW